MPKNTPVHRQYEAMVGEGMSKGKAARIAQAKTGTALATGMPPGMGKMGMGGMMAKKMPPPGMPPPGMPPKTTPRNEAMEQAMREMRKKR